jgi:hypothetical protein
VGLAHRPLRHPLISEFRRLLFNDRVVRLVDRFRLDDPDVVDEHQTLAVTVDPGRKGCWSPLMVVAVLVSATEARFRNCTPPDGEN